MKTLKDNLFCLCWMSIMILGVASCKDYTDDLQNLGKRVEELETKVLKINKLYEDLNTMVVVLQGYGRISDIKKIDEGVYSITIEYLDEEGKPISGQTKTFTLKNGQQGEDANMFISIRQDVDGAWYWYRTDINDWLRDANHQKMKAGAQDGEDAPRVIPIVRINYSFNPPIWEISNDGGARWNPIYDENNNVIPANGKDGLDDNVYSIDFNEGTGTLTIKFKGSNTAYTINYSSKTDPA